MKEGRLRGFLIHTSPDGTQVVRLGEGNERASYFLKRSW